MQERVARPKELQVGKVRVGQPVPLSMSNNVGGIRGVKRLMTGVRRLVTLGPTPEVEEPIAGPSVVRDPPRRVKPRLSQVVFGDRCVQKQQI